MRVTGSSTLVARLMRAFRPARNEATAGLLVSDRYTQHLLAPKPRRFGGTASRSRPLGSRLRPLGGALGFPAMVILLATTMMDVVLSAVGPDARAFASSPTWYSSLFAGGGGGPGPIGDGGPAAASSLYCATGVATDAAGDVAVSDSGCSTLPSVVRLASGTTGIVRTLVGDSGLCSDGVPAVSSCLANPGGVAMDPAGDVFIADTGHNRIRLVPASSGRFMGRL